MNLQVQCQQKLVFTLFVLKCIVSTLFLFNNYALKQNRLALYTTLMLMQATKQSASSPLFKTEDVKTNCIVRQ